MLVIIEDASDETAEAMSVIENYRCAAMSPAEQAHAALGQLVRQRGHKEETVRLMRRALEQWLADAFINTAVLLRRA